MKSILGEILLGGSKTVSLQSFMNLEYNNFRMTPSSQREMMNIGKLKMMPCFGKTQSGLLNDEELMRIPQDLALCFDGKKFFDAINIPHIVKV